MKLLLVGPYPPPHGGISVHVRGLEERSIAAGVPTRVLNSNNAGMSLVLAVMLYALRGWTIHFHTNGHNIRSWMLAGLCGVPAAIRGRGILTLHSGMTPGYIASAPLMHRSLMRVACSFYTRIICVNTAIRGAITDLHVPIAKTEVTEAFLGVQITNAPLGPEMERWIHSHSPLLSTAVFFRPEYGLDTLLQAIRVVRRLHPLVGCIVMGDSEHLPVGAKQVADAGLDKHILLAGDLDHAACISIMARCDAFIRPTLEDGDSVSVREAAGLGIPVVASNVGTRPVEAILFPRGNAQALAEKITLAVEGSKRMEQYA